MKSLRHSHAQVADATDTEDIRVTIELKVFVVSHMCRSDGTPVLDVKQEFHEDIDAIPTRLAIVNGLRGRSDDPA